MEIEVGEYVRTRDGVVAKVTYVDSFMIDTDNEVFDIGSEKMMEIPIESVERIVINHSKNIIDLIEVGDYVNGYRVVEIMEDMKTGEIHLEMTSDYTNQEIGDCTIYNKDIKSIVTKEQFKNIEYRLE